MKNGLMGFKDENLIFENLSNGKYTSLSVKAEKVSVTRLAKIIGVYEIKVKKFASVSALPAGSITGATPVGLTEDVYRAFTISVDNITGMAGYLMVEDKIDLIISKTVAGTPTTSYLMQNINIIAIGNASQYTGDATTLTDYSSITLEIPAEDCPMLTYNIVNGLVKIVLRGIEDDKTLTVSGVRN